MKHSLSLGVTIGLVASLPAHAQSAPQSNPQSGSPSAVASALAVAPPRHRAQGWVCGVSDSRGLRGGQPETWDDGVVYFEFDPAVTSQNRDRTYDAMEILMRVGADVAFVPRTPGMNDEDYIRIRNGSANTAAVGRNGQDALLEMSNWDEIYVIVHELLHTLGFQHEHTRWDRDSYVSVNLNNVADGIGLGNWDIQVLENWITTSTPYDFDSVMHYGDCAGSRCDPCCQVITALPPYQNQQDNMGQRDFLSALDAQDLRDAYGTGVRSHYMRPVGVGSTLGTLRNPFRSVREMNNGANAGSTVYVRGGATYDDGNLIQVIDEHLTIKPYQGVVTIQ